MDSALSAFVTLFAIVDPVGTTPLFIALTASHDAAGRQRIANRAILVSVGILVVFGLAGDAVLAFAGISMPAFRIAGGVLLFLTAIDMLFERRTARRERRAEDAAGSPDDPSVFPLAIPLIAGPGAIAAMILLVGEAAGDTAAQGVVFAMMGVVLAITWVLFRLGDPIGRALGRTGIMVVTRLMGMLLAALAVQFVIDGIVQTPLVAGAGG
ncbi:MAG: MarC family protein [Pikeienuella sp.]